MGPTRVLLGSMSFWLTTSRNFDPGSCKDLEPRQGEPSQTNRDY